MGLGVGVGLLVAGSQPEGDNNNLTLDYYTLQ